MYFMHSCPSSNPDVITNTSSSSLQPQQPPDSFDCSSRHSLLSPQTARSSASRLPPDMGTRHDANNLSLRMIHARVMPLHAIKVDEIMPFEMLVVS
jgi:hypothetical protein